jgi:hypothetical protein
MMAIYLALLMTDADYLALTTVQFNAPVHPGAQPVHQANATTAQITEANHQYDTLLTQVSLHVTVPFALSTDLVLTGIYDTVTALCNPFNNSPITPQTESQVQALLDVTSLLTNIATPTPTSPPSLLPIAPAVILPCPATPLRVKTPKATSEGGSVPWFFPR